jgi:hypothetical protein
MDAFCAKSYLSKLNLEPIFCFMLQNLCPILYLIFPYLFQFSLDSFLRGCLILIPISPSRQVQITYLIFIIERIIASIRYESLEGLISLTPFSTSQSHSRKILLPTLQLLSFAHSHPTTIITSSLT